MTGLYLLFVGEGKFYWYIAVFLAAVVSYILARNRSRDQAAFNAKKILEQEKRQKEFSELYQAKSEIPIVLYLRGFRADQYMSEYHFDNEKLRRYGIPVDDVPVVTHLGSYEEQIRLYAEKVGYFVAIDNGAINLEISQKVGATKIPLDNEVWEDKVSELMKQSRMILININWLPSKGVIWEYLTSLRNHPEKTVIQFNVPRKIYQYYRNVSLQVLKIKLPSYFSLWLRGKNIQVNKKNKCEIYSHFTWSRIYKELCFEKYIV